MDLKSNKKDYLTGVAVYFGFLIPVLIMNCSLKTTEVLDETSNLSIAAYLCGICNR